MTSMTARFAAAATAAALALGAAAPSLAQGTYGPPMNWSWEHGWWGMFMGPLMMIFLIAMIVVFVLLMRRVCGPGHRRSGRHGNAALDILKERFARGEIDKQEYEDRRKVLGD